MFETSIKKGTFFGDLGIRTYQSLSPVEGGMERALTLLGYVENDYFQFDSWTGIFKDGSKDFEVD
jgi:hypothetical protein